MINFIGIGAQKSGTSWLYACLYEHPEICAPVKELHFFSRDRFKKGRNWYESHFKRCAISQKTGEFSTSYLYSSQSPKRISTYYPDVSIIAVLREPAGRAYSQYRNAIKAGEINTNVTFQMYLETEESCIAQGLYSEQIMRYRSFFKDKQICIMIYEDIRKNPTAFLKQVYKHIGVDATFVPPSLNHKINTARTPKSIKIDRYMHYFAELLRRHGADKLVHAIKSSGATDAIRKINSADEEKQEFDLQPYKHYFRDDVKNLAEIINRDVYTQWNYDKT